MKHQASSRGGRPDRADKVAVALFAVFLSLCWLQGGVVVDPGSADEILQLFALPLIVLGGWRLAPDRIHRPMGLALCLAAAVLALPLLQLLPLPSLLGMSGSARHELAADLHAANATGTFAHLTLEILATERALWSLMPTLALFLGGLTLEGPLRRRMLQVVLLLVLASAAFAFYQESLPANSPELLYTQWGRNFGGFFINPNHQGTALVFGAVIAAALFVQGLRSDAHGRLAYRYWMYALLCAACVGMIPLARGTAAALLVVVGLLAVLVMIGIMPKMISRHRLLPRLYALGMGTLAIAVLCSAILVRHVDADRGTMAAQTARIGAKYAPFGTGMGSFVPVYLQEQELRMAQTKTINHAHDEYVQWWLEGGVPALLVVGFALGVFSWAGWRVLACTPSRRARAVAAPAWACLLVLLLHSVVDFPMRTTTLMATAGLFAGLLLGTLSETAQDMHTRRRRDVASQRA